MWFEDFERRTYNWKDVERALEVPCWLDEEALKFYELAADSIKRNYQELKRHLIKELNPSDREFEVKAELYSAKQEVNESVDEFAQRLLTIQMDWPKVEKPIIEKDMSKVFIRNCNPEIKRLIIADEGLPFNKLWRKARKIEKCNKEAKMETLEAISKVDETIETTAAVSALSQVKCFKCDNKGHMAKDCKVKQTKTTVSCALCGGKNHSLENCNQLKMLRSLAISKNSKPPTNNSNKSSNKFCSYCQMNNHTNRDCRHLQNKCFICLI